MLHFDSMSILARLLATEALNVTIKPVKTASFNLQTRELVIPNWHFRSIDLQRMLLAHEVSHALHTPYLELRTFLESYPENERSVVKGYLNVVEDCRIDKLIQRKYPGLKAAYVLAQQELIAMNFFQAEPHEFNDLNLIDRINIQFKLKSCVSVAFSDEEQSWVDRIAKAETFDEVMQITRELFDEQKLEMTTQTDDMDVTTGEAEPESGDAQGSGEAIPATGRINLTEEQMEALKAKTDEAMHNRLDIAASNVAVSVRGNGQHVKLKPVDPADVINDTWHQLSPKHQGFLPVKDRTPEEIAEELELNNFIRLFCGSFNRKKNARLFQRERESQTGLIDHNRLWQYQWEENLFKSYTVVDKQQNHGFVFLIDCSSSMDNVFPTVVRQFTMFTEICRRLQVPCVAYGFSDFYDAPGAIVPGFGIQRSCLIKLFDSSRKRTTNFTILEKLRNKHIHLNSTPLGNGLYHIRPIVEEFKIKKELDIVNLVVLTDGGDTTGGTYSFITDPKSSAIYATGLSPRGIYDNTSAMYQLLRDLYGCRVTYYDITDSITDSKFTETFKTRGYVCIKDYHGTDYSFFIERDRLKQSDHLLVNTMASMFS